MEDQFEAEALEISLGLQPYDPNFPPPDTVILQAELHVKPFFLCYEFGDTTIDCPPLCIKTGDCNHILAIPHWKDHPEYIIGEEDLTNFADLTTIEHPHFDLILFKSLAKDIEKKKGRELEMLKKIPIKESLHELLAKAKIPKTPKFDNVACMPAPDPREITNADEVWSERRSTLMKGQRVWKF
jgi:hypothetical protein